MKIYALVIVCTMSGATNILATEGIETQDVVQAIERHAARPFMAAGDKGKQNQKVRVHVLVDPGAVAAPVHNHAPVIEPKKVAYKIFLALFSSTKK